MSTAFAGIVAAMVDALSSAPAVSAQVYRARMRPMAQQHTTAVVVRIQDAQADRAAMQGAPVDFVTTIAVECYARSATQTPDLAVDDLLAAVYAKLAADSTLGGLVGDLYPSTLQYDFDTDAEQTACVTLTYQVVHRTANLSL